MKRSAPPDASMVQPVTKPLRPDARKAAVAAISSGKPKRPTGVSSAPSFFPNPGQENEVETILRCMVGPTRGEPGNEIYDLYKMKFMIFIKRRPIVTDRRRFICSNGIRKNTCPT